MIARSHIYARTMGIPDLTKFIEAEQDVWEDKTLRTATGRHGKLIIDGKPIVDGNLIVDGNCLSWYLISRDHIDCSHGGQYSQYKQTVQSFFKVLKNEGVRPIVVMDGVNLDNQYLKTRAEKRSTHIRSTGKIVRDHILTCFLFEVFCSTVTELDIELCVADGGGDEIVAKLANYYCCPVLAYDSDYFIFNLKKGYIPLNMLYIKSQGVKLKIYKIEIFAKKFGFEQNSLCYAIPAIFGNDLINKSEGYIDWICREVCIGGRYKAVCQYLRRFPSLEMFMDHKTPLGDKVRMEECPKTRQLYSIGEPYSIEHLRNPAHTVLKHHSGAELPEWLVMAFRSGNIPSYIIEVAVCQNTILPIMIDDVNSATSTGLSDHIRQCLYALLSCDNVTEYVRVEQKIVPKNLPCVKEINGTRIPNLFEIQELSKAQKEEVLYAILGCHGESLNSFDAKRYHFEADRYSKWKLTAAVTMYWAKNVGISISHELIKALIACFILCNSGYQDNIKCDTHHPYLHSQEWMNVLHAFSQWQYAYHCTLAVNTALMSLVTTPLSPANLYNGKLALYLASDLTNIDRKVDRYARDFPLFDMKVYSLLTEAVLSQLPAPPRPAPRKPAKKKRGTTRTKYAGKNRFDALQDLQDADL